MKALMFREHGGPEVLRYEDAPDPTPGPGEAVVKVGAVTINHGPDTMVRSGNFRMPVVLPHVSGSDPAGEVVAVGPGVDKALIGQRVVAVSMIACGACDFCAVGAGENYCRNFALLGVQRWGGRAEYVAVPARNLVELPDNVSYEQASALGMSYLTSYHGLVRKAQITAADSVLITSAGSGVGVAAIQIAKNVGATVIATTSTAWKIPLARDLGAALVVDSTTDDWPQQVLDATGGRGVSVLFDNLGPSSWNKSLKLLDRAGRFICSGATTGPELSLDVIACYRNQTSMHFYTNGSSADLRELVGLVSEGRIDPVIGSRYPLSEAAKAEVHVEDGDQFGKVVLIPDAIYNLHV